MPALLLAAALLSPAAAVAAARPDKPSAYEVVCRDLSRRGDPAAEAVCRRCLDLDEERKACQAGLDKAAAAPKPQTGSTNLLDTLCQTSLNNSDVEKAVDYCGQCVKVDPANRSCEANLRAAVSAAPTRTAQGRAPGGPIEQGPQAVPLTESSDAMKRYTAGVVFFQDGEYGKALEEWRACVHLEPGHPDCSAGLQRLKKMGYR